MKFNVEKCKVMHIGINNDKVKYLMNGMEVSNTNSERDLGVMISDDLNPRNQCSKVVKTANKLVGFIGHIFEHKSEKVILTLYNSLYTHSLNTVSSFGPRIIERTSKNWRQYSVE